MAAARRHRVAQRGRTRPRWPPSGRSPSSVSAIRRPAVTIAARRAWAIGLGHPPVTRRPDDDGAPARRPPERRTLGSRIADGRWRTRPGGVDPDVVVVEQLWLHRFARALPAIGAATVLDAHNVEADVYAAASRRAIAAATSPQLPPCRG